MIVTFALLTAAVVALWFGAGENSALRWLWLALLFAAACSALATGIAQPVGLAWLAALGGALALFADPRRPRLVRFAAAAVVLVLVAGLMTHQLAGFANPRVLSGVRLSADAVPYSLYLNFDKAAAGVLLLGLAHRRLGSGAAWTEMLRRAALPAGVSIATLLTLSLLAGYVRFDAKLPGFVLLWAWTNLCFTCLAEESLFRGFIQRHLGAALSPRRHGRWWALAVGAVLFGLAHAAGGAAYAALSMVAGLGYGWAYLRSGDRIEAAILTHFTLNAFHFLGFTYPALA